MSTASAALSQPPANQPPPEAPLPNTGKGGGSTGDTTPPGPAWYDSIKNPEIKTWLSGKKPPDAETALSSYYNLERTVGAEKAGRTVMLPKDDNDVEGMTALARRLGVPEKVEEYKLALPENADPEFSARMVKAFHQAGIPPRAANIVAKEWETFLSEAVAKNDAESARVAAENKTKAETRAALEMGQLESEWGKDFAANSEIAKRGVREFGERLGMYGEDGKPIPDLMEKLEGVLGTSNMMRFFHGVGQLNAETSFEGGQKPPSSGFATDKATAEARIAALTKMRKEGKDNDHWWHSEAEPEIKKLLEVIAR